MALSTQAATRKDETTGASAQLQHRHFAFIASVLADTKPDKDAIYLAQQWATMVKAFAQACERTNPNFDQYRFYRACGAV